MLQKEYTFAEIKLFAVCPDREYIRLYHKLNYRRVDDRLRVMQEVVKKRLLDKVTSEETLERVAAFLSHKPLSKWVKEELGKYFRPSRDGYTRFVYFLGRSCTFSSRSEKLVSNCGI